MIFLAGFVTGAVLMTMACIVDDLRGARESGDPDPHCRDCAKLMHRCHCPGGPV